MENNGEPVGDVMDVMDLVDKWMWSGGGEEAFVQWIHQTLAPKERRRFIVEWERASSIIRRPIVRPRRAGKHIGIWMPLSMVATFVFAIGALAWTVREKSEVAQVQRQQAIIATDQAEEDRRLRDEAEALKRRIEQRAVWRMERIKDAASQEQWLPLVQRIAIATDWLDDPDAYTEVTHAEFESTIAEAWVTMFNRLYGEEAPLRLQSVIQEIQDGH